jgi:hypothetical protein
MSVSCTVLGLCARWYKGMARHTSKSACATRIEIADGHVAAALRTIGLNDWLLRREQAEDAAIFSKCQIDSNELEMAEEGWELYWGMTEAQARRVQTFPKAVASAQCSADTWCRDGVGISGWGRVARTFSGRVTCCSSGNLSHDCAAAGD